jgi:MFS-type transporter involved in bile tolerance (Atg22 family)
MSAIQITAFVVLNLVTNPIGIILHRTLARKVGHKRSYVGCIAYTLIITSIMLGAVHSPEQTNLAFFFSVLVGISFGWYYPSSNGYFCALVPQEKVTELWGLNSFCSVILSWVPPIIYTALNETTGNIRVGWIGVIIFELLGLVIALTIPEKKDISTDKMYCSVDEKKGSGVDEEEGHDEPPPPVRAGSSTVDEMTGAGGV